LVINIWSIRDARSEKHQVTLTICNTHCFSTTTMVTHCYIMCTLHVLLS